MTAQRDETLTAALDYISRGFGILPLKARDKRPHFDLLPRSPGNMPSWARLRDYPATETDVRAWLHYDPHLNLGIMTGDTSGGLAVVDIDRVPPRGTILPPTAFVRTARGSHAYYRVRGDLPSCRLPYGELMAAGRYVVAPPSRSAQRCRYEWIGGLGLDEVGVTELPDCFYEAARASTLDKVPSRGYEPSLLRTTKVITAADLRRWDATTWTARRQAQALGIASPSVEATFRCVLPGHEERRPSATLWRDRKGCWMYHDWHTDIPWLTLAEVRAAIASGVIRKLRPPEMVVWHLRLLLEAGVVAPALVLAPEAPLDMLASTRKLYEGFVLLLSCKTLYGSNGPSAFARTFASSWCGIAPMTVVRGMNELEDRRLVRRVGIDHRSRSNLFVPRGEGPSRVPTGWAAPGPDFAV